MSATYGPCPKCGKQCMYDVRTPTSCYECRTVIIQYMKSTRVRAANLKAHREGNRKARRKAKKVGKS